MRNGGWLLALAAVGGCGTSEREAAVRFSGRPPGAAFAEDTRAAVLACPACERPLEPGSDRCAGGCPGRFRPPAEVPCGFCGSSGGCAPCAAFEAAGECRFCGGSGGEPDRPCPGCAGSGRCAACGGSSRCDACAGSGRLALPWRRARPAGATPPAPRRRAAPVRAEPLLARPGQEVRWSRPVPDPGARWTIVRLEDGARREAAAATGEPVRFVPDRPGSYAAFSAGLRVAFEVVAARIEVLTPRVVAPGGKVEARAVCDPPLRGAEAVWTLIGPGAEPGRFEGTSVAAVLREPGRYALEVGLILPGEPAWRASAREALACADLRVVAPGETPLAAGLPQRFRAEGAGVLPEGEPLTWIVTAPDGTRSERSGGAETDLVLEVSGVHRVRVRAGAAESADREVAAFHVTLRDAAGRVLREVRPALLHGAFDAEGRFDEGAPTRLPEAVRVWVEDPARGPAGSVHVATRGLGGALLDPPVSYALSAEGRTRPLLFVTDPVDDAAPTACGPDGAPEDPTRRAAPQGRVEVVYRDRPAAVVPMGPALVHEIPVRFVLEGEDPGDEWARALDGRLAEANAIWEPFGRRFVRAGLRRAERARGLLLVRGRAAGADAKGGPGRVGAVFDGRERSIPTAWGDGGPPTPVASARALADALADGAVRAEVFEGLLEGDSDAAILRVLRGDGRPARVEPLAAGADVGQAAVPLSGKGGGGCEVAVRTRGLSLDEAALLLGARSGEGRGVDVFVVGEVWAGSERPAYKVYPSWAYPPPASGAVVAARRIADGSGRYPYALARALGELFLPEGWRPGEGDTLFEEPLSEAPGVLARKRVGPQTAARMFEPGGRD